MTKIRNFCVKLAQSNNAISGPLIRSILRFVSCLHILRSTHFVFSGDPHCRALRICIFYGGHTLLASLISSLPPAFGISSVLFAQLHSSEGADRGEGADRWLPSCPRMTTVMY